jgi:hypothetical protein
MVVQTPLHTFRCANRHLGINHDAPKAPGTPRVGDHPDNAFVSTYATAHSRATGPLRRAFASTTEPSNGGRNDATDWAPGNSSWGNICPGVTARRKSNNRLPIVDHGIGFRDLVVDDSDDQGRQLGWIEAHALYLPTKKLATLSKSSRSFRSP